MPTVQPHTGLRILVTGGNGYIGAWTVRELLEQGYTIRGTVRSQDKADRLQNYFGSYGEKVEWVVVEDITKEGAFDDAVKDVDAVVHMASPVSDSTLEPDDVIKPAVQGTTGILRSALKYGTKLKRVIITSSCGSLLSIVNERPDNPPVMFNEENWGDDFVNVVQAMGKEAPGVIKYIASKTLAERAVWTIYSEHKKDIGWDLVVINPSLVLGPSLQNAKTPDDLNFSLEFFWRNITTDKSHEELLIPYSYIDVRDVAAAHVIALSKEEAGNERIIVSSGPITWQETRNVLYNLRPTLYTTGVLPRGKPELDKTVWYDYDPEKGKRIFGIKYRSGEEIFNDTLAYFEERGWLEKPVTVTA